MLSSTFLFSKTVNKHAWELNGKWVTDSSDGYAIQMKIKNDSAYLSQSNRSEIQAYKMNIAESSFTIENEDLGKYYQWEYSLLNNSILLLFNASDTLKFNKINNSQ